MIGHDYIEIVVGIMIVLNCNDILMIVRVQLIIYRVVFHNCIFLQIKYCPVLGLEQQQQLLGIAIVSGIGYVWIALKRKT